MTAADAACMTAANPVLFAGMPFSWLKHASILAAAARPSFLCFSGGPGQYQCMQSLVWHGMQNTSMERMSSYSNGGSGANSDTEAALHIAAPQHCGKLEAVPQVCSEASCTSCCAVPADLVPLEIQSKGPATSAVNTSHGGYPEGTGSYGGT